LELIEKHEHWPQRQENMSIGHNAKKYSYDKTKVSYPNEMKYKNSTVQLYSKLVFISILLRGKD
jgi:hypothetical protein